MPPESTPVLNTSSKSGAVVLAPGEKFFVRRLPLAPDGDPAAQVELALEDLSPFPAGQLFHGFRTDTAGAQALVYAAYRKNFTPDETAAWAEATAVLPEFAVWLATGSVPAAGVWVREQSGRVEVIAWDGRSELPAAVMVRPVAGLERDGLIADARRKAGLAPDAPVKSFSSAVESTREKRSLVVRLASGGIEARFDETILGQADIRDKGLLAERRRTLRRDTLLWRGFAAALGGLAACVLLELGLLATHTWLGGQQREINAQAAAVKQVTLVQSMAKRLEEISAQRVLPFEMLAELQEKRPKSVEFTRATTNGLWRIDIEAQTANAADLHDFEAEVRRLAGIERVEVRDPRTREGVTTFVMEVIFKPGWSKLGGGT